MYLCAQSVESDVAPMCERQRYRGTFGLERWPMSITLSLLLAIIGLVSLWLMFGVGRGGQG
jgi:hypothetical protein